MVVCLFGAKLCLINYSYLAKEKCIRTFGASQSLGASEPSPWRPQVYMTLTLTHLSLKPQGSNNCLEIFKNSGKQNDGFIAHKKGF